MIQKAVTYIFKNTTKQYNRSEYKFDAKYKIDVDILYFDRISLRNVKLNSHVML